MEQIIEYITRAKNNKNDFEAWENIYNHYKKYLLKIISHYIYDVHNQENILQETWIRVYKLIDKYDEQYKFTMWLMLNATNVCKNWLKSNKKTNEIVSLTDLISEVAENNNDEYTSQNFEEDFCKKQLINEALEKVVKSDEEKLALKLKYIDDLPLKDISKILNEKESVVKNWIYRNREKLAEYIKSHM